MAKATVCHIGPVSIHSGRLMEAFLQKGYRLSLISDSKAWIAPKPSESVRIFVLPQLTQANFLERFVPNSVRIIKILREINPDFVHLHAEHQYSPAVSLSGFPFLLNSWGMEVLELPAANRLRKVLAVTTARKARRIIVDAKILKEIWVALGVCDQKVEVVPFGVDVNIFNPKVDGSSIREELQIEKDDIAVISTRPFYDSHYDIECLIRAIPLVARNHANAKFIVKGSGPLRQYLGDLTKELKVSEYVRFVGLVPHFEVARYLRAAEIYVSTSFIDSTSVSLLEAMACGLAPVTTDIPGNREWIQDGVNGWLYPPKNHEALAERIVQLIENYDQRRQFGKKCFKIVEKNATWDKCISRMETIYEGIASS